MANRGLFYMLRGLSGASCSHGDGYGGRENFEACEKHHTAVAYDIVRQWLLTEEARNALNFGVNPADWRQNVEKLLPKVER